ncbi:hypothetical protein C8R45DRAFT_1023190, partial [Mycena sanguinolenta]
MPFIESLPPSAEVAELLPLIHRINPECIFAFFGNVPRHMLAWLKKIPSAPPDLIKLWKDYECMVSFERTVLLGSPTEHSFPCNPGFLRILVSLWFRSDSFIGLREIRGQLDLTWTEMRTSICGPSSNVARDRHVLPVSAARLAFRDIALEYIRKMVKNHLDMDG